MNFDGRIPPDLPPFPGGVDGTEFFPDPFFYGEETWDGLELRLQLYLAYQHKDLAVAALARGRPETARSHYEALAQALQARPVRESILRDIHAALIDWATRAQAALEVVSMTPTAASTLLNQVPWKNDPADTAWRRFLDAAIRFRENDPKEACTLAKQGAGILRRLLPGPPWRPIAHGPAPTMADRHRDRLDRVQAYVRWFNPFSTREIWGQYDQVETTRSLWVRMTAATLAQCGDATQRAKAVQALLDHLPESAGLTVDRNRLLRGVSTGPQDPIALLTLADTSIETDEQAHPQTSVERLQGMPTGDSYLDLLGQAGAPAVGRTRKLSLDDPDHRAWTAQYATAINQAIARGDVAQIGPILEHMISELNQHSFDSKYFNIKRVRNEGIRLLVATGQPDQALALLQGFFPLQDLDFRVPNRRGVLEAIRGRILLAAGRLDEAEQAFRQALDHTRRWLEYVDRYRNRRPGPAGPPATHE